MHALSRRSRIARRLATILMLLHGLVLLASGAEAAGILRYQTDGAVAAYGLPDPRSTISGPSVVSFEGTPGALLDRQPFLLGSFAIAPPPAGATSTYHATPFVIELHVPEADRVLDPSGPGELPTRIDASLVIHGHLDGVVGSNGVPDLSATIDSVTPGSLRVFTLDHIQRFDFPLDPALLRFDTSQVVMPLPEATRAPGESLRLDPYADALGYRVELVAEFVPEPASWAVFALLALSAGAARRARHTARSRPRGLARTASETDHE